MITLILQPNIMQKNIISFVLLMLISWVIPPYLCGQNQISIDLTEIQNSLSVTPSDVSKSSLRLPMPNGELIHFYFQESSVMETDMQSQYPELKSYLIQAIHDESIKGRLALSPTNIVAILNTPDGYLFIEPTNRYNTEAPYLVYYGKDLDANEGVTSCGEIETTPPTTEDLSIEKAAVNCLNFGTTLRTFRIAIATTGEFTNGIGNGSLATTNMIINERLTALNVIYENELSVHFDLVANNDNIIFFDANADGLNPSNGSTQVSSAHTVITSTIGAANYDIGHAFYELADTTGWSAGGLAGLGVVCNNSLKGRGWTGAEPDTPLFGFMDVFAHEVGHQFDADHTFYGTAGNCGGTGQRAAGNGYEPGSGNSLMSYQGTCIDNNYNHNITPSTSTLYFHIHSLIQIDNYINSQSCQATSSTGNTPPTVTVPTTNYTIPKGTPFCLEGSATDAEDTALTYNWEEYDTDNLVLSVPQGNPNDAATSTIAPLFRSFDPSVDGYKRTFPQISDILDNTQTLGEILPQVSRNITMRLTVRDNHADGSGMGVTGGGVSCEEVNLTVNANAGPFLVTSQNSATTLTSNGSNNFTVNWDVAGTTGNGVNCANVDILFSTDGGQTFPNVLASGVPNDGNETLLVPNLATTFGRIKIVCSDNIFFDINNTDITIQSNCSADGASFSPTNDVSANVGDAALNLTLSPDYGNVLTGSISSAGGIFSNGVTRDNGGCQAIGNQVNYITQEFYVATSGTYTFSGPFPSIINIFEGAFTGFQCTNWLGSTWQGSSLGSISLSLSAGQLYTIALSGFDLSTTGTLNFSSITGPGNLYDGLPAPSSASFSYTYIAVDNATGNIVDIDANADFTDLNGGTYTVYGVSVENASLATLNTYLNGSFSSLQTAILSATLCANISNNSIMLTIMGSGVVGCTDNGACNYNPNATINSGCEYTSCADCAGVPNGTNTLDNCGVCDANAANDDITCLGCTDPNACNYDTNATIDDMSCEYVSCACPNSLNVTGSIASGLYEAMNDVTSNGQVNAMDTVTFHADNYIELNGNFDVPINTQFTADIQPCFTIPIFKPTESQEVLKKD